MIESYDKLPLGKYADICAVCNSDRDEIDKQVAIIAILADITEDEVLTLPILDYKAHAAKAAFLEMQPVADMRNVRKCRLAGRDFTLTDNAVKVTTAQYVDFQTYAKMDGDHLAEIASVFLIPAGHRYNDGYDLAEVQAIIRVNLSVTAANGMVSFFLTSSAVSMRVFLHFLTRKVKKAKMTKAETKAARKELKKAEEHLRAVGDGLQALTQLRRPADAVGRKWAGSQQSNS